MKSRIKNIIVMKKSNIYVTQEIQGTSIGIPRINIMGATEYGYLNFLLPEHSQMIYSPAPLISQLRKKLKDFNDNDYLLLTGDPAIMAVAVSIVSILNNGKFKLLKWDKQEFKYYPLEINLHKGGRSE